MATRKLSYADNINSEVKHMRANKVYNYCEFTKICRKIFVIKRYRSDHTIFVCEGRHILFARNLNRMIYERLIKK